MAVPNAGPRELILIRHGQSTANVASDVAEATGAEAIDVQVRDADVPLTALGEEQADAFGRWLAGQLPVVEPIQVWSSPYLRARHTAERALAAAHRADPVQLDERLRDKELGILDKLTWRGVQLRFPQEWQRRQWLGRFYYRPPAGESWADLSLRTRSFLADLPTARTTAVFTHDAMVFLFRYVCERLDESQVLDLAQSCSIGNCAVTRLRSEDGGSSWHIESFNDVSHLHELATPAS